MYKYAPTVIITNINKHGFMITKIMFYISEK